MASGEGRNQNDETGMANQGAMNNAPMPGGLAPHRPAIRHSSMGVDSPFRFLHSPWASTRGGLGFPFPRLVFPRFWLIFPQFWLVFPLYGPLTTDHGLPSPSPHSPLPKENKIFRSSPRVAATKCTARATKSSGDESGGGYRLRIFHFERGLRCGPTGALHGGGLYPHHRCRASRLRR